MLENLITAIETLKERIKEHRSYFDTGFPEARTRVALIDPLLQALEWDVANPSQVAIEPKAAAGRADYALLRKSGEPLLLLEAKKLSDAKAHYRQLAGYVVGENMKRTVKIPYCALSNGSRWQVFDVFAQECVLEVSVERDPPRQCALKLLGLWQPALREAATLEPVADLGQQMVQIPPAPPTDPPTHKWTPLDSATMNPSGRNQPSEVRFPDGNTSNVGTWNGMLVATAEWLLDTGLLNREEIPFTVAGTRYCVSEDGRRPDGTKFGRPLPVGDTGVQIEGDFSAKEIVRFATGLLERYDVMPSQVALRLPD